MGLMEISGAVRKFTENASAVEMAKVLVRVAWAHPEIVFNAINYVDPAIAAEELSVDLAAKELAFQTQIIWYMDNNKKVSAVKLWREETGASLREALTAVTKIYDDWNLDPIEEDDENPSNCQCDRCGNDGSSEPCPYTKRQCDCCDRCRMACE